MTLDEKCSLTAGASMWYLPPVERLGIRALKMSDGPSGVRGDSLIGRRSLSLPCGMAVGSTWNPELVRRLGDVLAAEARSKGVHVLLGPTVCIVRTPLAGRTFESFSEDPLLTARLAVAYVHGRAGRRGRLLHQALRLQRPGARADDHQRRGRRAHPAGDPPRRLRTRRTEAGVWSVMTAYNKVNGIYCGEQPDLIDGVLRGEWGFDGLVMSDWFGTHSTVPAVRAGLDLEMPGPSAWLGPDPGRGRARRAVDESVVDEPGPPRPAPHGAGRDARWHGDRSAEEQEEDDPGRRAVAREVAAEGTVLLVNDGLLPLDPAEVSSVAVIGPNAGQLAMGGGSSEVTPHRRRSVADALAERLPGARRSPTRWGAASTAGCPPSTCGCSTASASSSSTSTAPTAGRAGAGRGRAWPTRPASCGSGRRSPASRSAGARCGSAASSRPTCRGGGGWGSRAPGVPCCASTATSSSTTPSPTGARASTGRGASRSRSSYDLEAGRSYELAVEVWPRSASSPIMGARIGAATPDPGDEFERAVDAAGGGRRRRGRRRLQRAVGVRGPRPAGPVAAGPPARARRGGARGQPAHRGRRQRGLAGRDALGGAGRGRAAAVVPGRGGCGRAGRHRGRGVGAVGTAARHVPRAGRGRADRRCRRAVPRRRRQGRLRRGRPRRLPALRDGPRGARSSRSGTACPTATSSSRTSCGHGRAGDGAARQPGRAAGHRGRAGVRARAGVPR